MFEVVWTELNRACFLSWVFTSKFKVRFLHCDWHQGLSICSRHCISWTEKILIKIQHKVVTALLCILTLTLPMGKVGQFHQPYGAKRKCTSRHSLAPVNTVQFHQQNYTQLHHCAQVGNTLNFYAVRPTLYASKISVNLLAQKLHRKCWWNWPEGSISSISYWQHLNQKVYVKLTGTNGRAYSVDVEHFFYLFVK